MRLHFLQYGRQFIKSVSHALQSLATFQGQSSSTFPETRVKRLLPNHILHIIHKIKCIFTKEANISFQRVQKWRLWCENVMQYLFAIFAAIPFLRMYPKRAQMNSALISHVQWKKGYTFDQVGIQDKEAMEVRHIFQKLISNKCIFVLL